jgi:xanthine/uracil permease
VSIGVLPTASPQLFAHAPEEARLFLNSGIFLTAVIAVLLNLFFSSRRNDGTGH